MWISFLSTSVYENENKDKMNIEHDLSEELENNNIQQWIYELIIEITEKSEKLPSILLRNEFSFKVWAGDVAQMAEHLPSQHKALSSIPSTSNK